MILSLGARRFYGDPTDLQRARSVGPSLSARGGHRVGWPPGRAFRYRRRLTGIETSRRLEIPPSRLSPCLRARMKNTSNCCRGVAG